ncbi:MAG: septum site-determining protein MinC [Clostridia bacterium]|nr:septum site-determining protein MinC [Clostridia bacterium]
MKNSISIQTKKDKTIIKIEEEADQKQILQELKKKLTELKKLYQEDTTPIYITGKVFKNKEMEQIQETIEKVLPVEIKFDSPKILGLHGIKRSFSKEIATSETKFHRGSLRSGQKIEFEGSLVILGDVNAGAEVLAGENIVVLGILRGMAHAGAKGNKEAIIAAASIESPQIRIANKVKEIEKEELEEEIKTCAYVDEQGELVLE